MRLNEDAVDRIEVDGPGLRAHGFDEGAQAQVAGPPQEPLRRTDDERERLLGKGINRFTSRQTTIGRMNNATRFERIKAREGGASCRGALYRMRFSWIGYR